MKKPMVDCYISVSVGKCVDRSALKRISIAAMTPPSWPLPAIGALLFCASSAMAQITVPPISDYKAWLRADQGTVLDANSKVSQWQDQSGNGNHLGQTNPAQRPTVEAVGLGNQAAVRFYGKGDGLWGVETMNFGWLSTVFVVFERLKKADGLVEQDSDGGQWWWIAGRSSYPDGYVRNVPVSSSTSGNRKFPYDSSGKLRISQSYA